MIVVVEEGQRERERERERGVDSKSDSLPFQNQASKDKEPHKELDLLLITSIRCTKQLIQVNISLKGLSSFWANRISHRK